MSFPFETTVPVRYSDVDTYGHVNNAVYATYMEQGRIAYLDEVLGEAARSLTATADGEESGTGDGGSGDAREDDTADAGIVVASLELDFERPIRLGDDVAVAVRVPRLGESSFPFEYEVRADGEVAAVGETTMVSYDRGAGGPRPIPDGWREQIAAFEGL